MTFKTFPSPKKVHVLFTQVTVLCCFSLCFDQIPYCSLTADKNINNTIFSDKNKVIILNLKG